MPKTVFIYCLKDPRNGDVRYIGQTNNLKLRLQRHIRDSSRLKSHLGNWLRSLNGEKPVLAVLHEVSENECRQEEERRYISCARAVGVDLVNGTDGGDGISGHVFTPEQCAAKSARQKGVPHSPEWSAAISAAKKGVPQSPAARAANSAARKGVPHSPEHRAKISVGLSAAYKKEPRGPHSPEHCAAISAAQMGVPWTEAQRAAKEGVPWSASRRAAHERSKLAKSTAK